MVIEARSIYQYRNLQENLSWKQDGKRVLAQGMFSNAWMSHRRGDVRLRRRRGLEVRFRRGTKLLGWPKLRGFVRASDSKIPIEVVASGKGPIRRGLSRWAGKPTRRRSADDRLG